MRKSNVVVVFTAALFATAITLLLSLKLGYEPLVWRKSYNTRHKDSGSPPGTFLLGVGKADITGPVVELNFIGYADPKQVGTGLRQRIYSRAFIISDIDRPKNRFVYLVLDVQAGDTAIRYGVAEALAQLGPDFASYGLHNIAVTGTHSHSGPGAWSNYLLPQITSKGFDQQSYQAIVDGTVLSIVRAHNSLRHGKLYSNKGKINDTNINRSLFAYQANPSDERARYRDNVDKEMTILRFTDAASNKDIGVLTWFAVHGTSMFGNNTLVSGDNKGVAALMFEKAAQHWPHAATDLVAGFSQSNVGDTSPNVLGAYCEDGSHRSCSFDKSLCEGKSQLCHGRGPEFRKQDQGASSCFEIGRRQYEGAKAIYEESRRSPQPLKGSSVMTSFQFRDLSNYSFSLDNGTIVRTCPAALGYSFAAGTTDGPGAFDFKQNEPGDPNVNPLWAIARRALKEPSQAQMQCHAPKPILLDVGEISSPYAWAPNLVDIQLFRAGNMIFIISPGEATTMSGRRWKGALSTRWSQITNSTPNELEIVLGGPSNSYTFYIATEEEYAIQRYEGAATIYGPHTLNAYINLTTLALEHLLPGSDHEPPFAVQPPNNVNKSLSFITGIAVDNPPLFKSFGDIISDVQPSYRAGDTIRVGFVAGNPRNDLRLEETYAAVERIVGQSKPMRVRDDSDWDLIFSWKRTSTIFGTSEAEITWVTDSFLEPGRYCIRYFGASKSLNAHVTQFTGASSTFEIL